MNLYTKEYISDDILHSRISELAYSGELEFCPKL